MEDNKFIFFNPSLLIKVILSGIFVFLGLLFLSSTSIAGGFGVGFSASIVIFWTNWEGMSKLARNLKKLDQNRKRLIQSSVIGYLVTYFLFGIMLWIGVKFDTIDFYAVSAGALLPLVVLRLNGSLKEE